MTLTKSISPFDLLFGLGCQVSDASPELSGGSTRPAHRPTTEIVEEDDRYTVVVELPGVAKEDIEVKISDGVLTVKATKKSETVSENGRVRFSERRYGDYQRSWSLPESVNEEEVGAAYTDGVLKLTIQKVQPVQPKEIAIQIN